jgi:hypothetical protein
MSTTPATSVRVRTDPILIRKGARKAVPTAEPMPPATEMAAAATATWAVVVNRAVAAFAAGVMIWPSMATRKTRKMRLGIDAPNTAGTMKHAAACSP